MRGNGNVVPFQQRMFEMIGPSLSPFPPPGTLGQANTRSPTYFDVNGKPITSIQCGGAFTFDVPGSGLNQIWLTIYKDGTKTYDALFSIPMPTYVTTCEADIGNYQVIAYDPASGIVLGQTSMVITSASGMPSPSSGGGIVSWLSNLSTPAKLALAGGAFFLVRKKKQ
jgi:hypothetical protein